MKKEYDIICIGAGSGGLNIAGFMNKAGFKTLLIDKTDKSIGGDCLNFGCVPSKALIHLGKIAKHAKEAEKLGLKRKGKIDMKKVREYITEKKEIIREHENASYFKSIGMEVVLGKAKFVDKKTIRVKNQEFTARKIILATGSRPRKLNIPGIENLTYGKNLFDNENIFDMKSLPRKIVVVGGGPIGTELGQALSRLGSKVTIIQGGNRFLPKEDPEASTILLKQLKKEGVDFSFNHRPTEITKKKEIIVHGKKIKFDALLVSIGRELNTDLDLENAGIELDSRGKVVVNEYLQTTNKRVYTCGDIAGGPMFTHTAELHAGIIIRNFFAPFRKKYSYDKLSWVTYTDPEIATFGLSEEEIKHRKIKYERLSENLKDDDRAIVTNNTQGKIILYIDKKKKLLGGTLITPNAGEIIQELLLINNEGLTIDTLFRKIYPYPTASRINKKVISNKFKEKLTPFTKKLFKLLYH